jgi:adenylate kinase
VIIILGTPGAGKTTQTQQLGEYLNCPWFSMGELIRQKVTGKDREEMLTGKIIGDEVTLKIVDESLSEIDTVNKECVFEGNPRSIPQAQWWLEQIQKGRFKLHGVLHLVVDHERAQTRMEKRGRVDDENDDVIKKRFDEYHRSIDPTLSYLKEHGVAVHEIDASGTIEEVAENIHKILGI